MTSTADMVPCEKGREVLSEASDGEQGEHVMTQGIRATKRKMTTQFVCI